MDVASKGTETVARTEANPFVAQDHGTSVGTSLLTRRNAKGKRCPMGTARGAIVKAVTKKRKRRSQLCEKDSQESSRNR